MAEVYQQEDYSSGYPEGIELHFWHRARNDLIYRWLSPQLASGELVMDVGCGIGLVVADLRSRGINARGVELGEATAFPGAGDHVRSGCDLFDLPAGEREQIRAILLLDVIEHMADRRNFLQKIGRACPNCELLLVTVPARSELWSSFDEHWGHHLRYNRPQLREDLAAAGFAARKTGYFFHWLYLVSLAMKALRIPRGNQFRPIHRGSLKALLHRLLAAFSRLENRILPGALAGSSIACIARRKDS